MKYLRKIIRVFILGVFGVFIWNISTFAYIKWGYDIYEELQDIPEKEVAIVFGAGLDQNGNLSAILKDRVSSGIDLYKEGKVKKILMSGSKEEFYNEPNKMSQEALRQGVLKEDILIDFEGDRTKATCERASSIFGIKSAVLVTQEYHLPRSLFLCNSKGISSVGFVADKRPYLNQDKYNQREFFAIFVSIWEVLFDSLGIE